LEEGSWFERQWACRSLIEGIAAWRIMMLRQLGKGEILRLAAQEQPVADGWIFLNIQLWPPSQAT